MFFLVKLDIHFTFITQIYICCNNENSHALCLHHPLVHGNYAFWKAYKSLFLTIIPFFTILQIFDFVYLGWIKKLFFRYRVKRNVELDKRSEKIIFVISKPQLHLCLRNNYILTYNITIIYQQTYKINFNNT